MSLAALRANLQRVRGVIARGTEVIGCVKADAYGHGLVPIARCLEQEGVRWLALGDPAEALELRRHGIRCRVLLFPTRLGDEVEALVRAGIAIGVQSAREVETVATQGGGGTVELFLEVDAGLGRAGVPLSEAPGLAARIAAMGPRVSLAGVFTHLPFSDAEGAVWATERLADFGRVVAAIRARVPGPLLVQALASAGVAGGLEAPGANAVCPGQLLLGLEPPTAGSGWAKLGTQPALAGVFTELGPTRDVPAGARFDPGGARTAPRATRLGVLPIGYANSLLVHKVGQAVQVAGRRVPVLSVSLEHAVVDLTDAPEASEGATVALLSADPATGPTLAEVARAQGRSPLEVLVAVTGRATHAYTED